MEYKSFKTFDIAKSPTKPGEDWIKITDEIADKLIKFEEKNIRDLKRWDELIHQATIRKVAE